MRYLILLVLIVSFVHGVQCDDYYLRSTGEYDYRCAAKFLNMRTKDYSWSMALLGGFTGLAFLSSVIYIILHIGKSRKV